jgi:hypothetical protein
MGKALNILRWLKALILAAAALAAGCGQVEQPAMDPAFGDRLEHLGFFKYLCDTERDAAKGEFRTAGWAAVYGETGRMFPADAESLAEGGIDEFLREIEPFLGRQGVTINQLEEHIDENGYTVSLNEVEHVIYNVEELKRDRERLVSIWGLATARGFALVNKLLADSGSDERLYAVNGGNDLFGIFLSPELRAAVCEHPDATLSDRPYVPNEEHPWYGQEHD